MLDDSDQMFVTFPVSGDDEEVRVIQVVAQAIQGLDDDAARVRVLRWALDRYSPDSSTGSDQ